MNIFRKLYLKWKGIDEVKSANLFADGYIIRVAFDDGIHYYKYKDGKFKSIFNTDLTIEKERILSKLYPKLKEGKEFRDGKWIRS